MIKIIMNFNYDNKAGGYKAHLKAVNDDPNSKIIPEVFSDNYDSSYTDEYTIGPCKNDRLLRDKILTVLNKAQSRTILLGIRYEETKTAFL